MLVMYSDVTIFPYAHGPTVVRDPHFYSCYLNNPISKP